jgi:hypothetical protein
MKSISHTHSDRHAIEATAMLIAAAALSQYRHGRLPVKPVVHTMVMDAKAAKINAIIERYVVELSSSKFEQVPICLPEVA